MTSEELTAEIVRLTALVERLKRIAETYKQRRDYWRERYYAIIHNKPDMPDIFKDIFKDGQ